MITIVDNVTGMLRVLGFSGFSWGCATSHLAGVCGWRPFLMQSAMFSVLALLPVLVFCVHVFHVCATVLESLIYYDVQCRDVFSFSTTPISVVQRCGSYVVCGAADVDVVRILDCEKSDLKAVCVLCSVNAFLFRSCIFSM